MKKKSKKFELTPDGDKIYHTVMNCEWVNDERYEKQKDTYIYTLVLPRIRKEDSDKRAKQLRRFIRGKLQYPYVLNSNWRVVELYTKYYNDIQSFKEHMKLYEEKF